MTKFDIVGTSPEPKHTTVVKYPYGTVSFDKFGEDSVKITITGKFNAWAGLLFSGSMKDADANMLEIYGRN